MSIKEADMTPPAPQDALAGTGAQAAIIPFPAPAVEASPVDPGDRTACLIAIYQYLITRQRRQLTNPSGDRDDACSVIDAVRARDQAPTAQAA